MSSGNPNDTANQQDLIGKLCEHFAKNDKNLSSNLSKVAYGYLASSATLGTNQVNEQLIVQYIRDSLGAQSNDSVEKFDFLYSKLCKSTILKNRPAILSLLLNLTKNKSKSSLNWPAIDVLEKLPSFSLKTRSHTNHKSTISHESVQHIFRAKDGKQMTSSTPYSSNATSQSTLVSTLNYTRNLTNIPITDLITEKQLMQDVIYTFQGVEGKYVCREAGGLGFVISPKYERYIRPIHRSLLDRLLGISFLHNQIRQYYDNTDTQSGIMSQALVATFRDELSSYYKSIAILQTTMQKGTPESPDLTLRKILVYMFEHHTQLEWLAYIAVQCSDKKGGALVTAIHGFLQHGAVSVQKLSEKVLKNVCKPLYIMLSHWLLDGEINDPYNEFFIEVKNIMSAERLWHDKYHVRKSMIPSFITMNQAKKILATGKSINFSRQICKDSGEFAGREMLQKFFRTTLADSLFTPEQSIEFDTMLQKIYKETSLRVLDLLRKEYRLFEHLQSLRRYLLLGQGDFIRHLLETLAPELDKPAQDICGHTLTTILDSAIRVTNAQFEDEDTLQRLNVSFMSHSHGDTGWDVFSLVYLIDGPIGTVFKPMMTTYQCLFGALWKAKRMEFVLSNMRKQQITMAKAYREIDELKPVTHVFHTLTSKVIHFLDQTQYYFLFEVLECSWAEMLKQVNHAEDLDDVINAHTSFLKSVECGVLLDENSKPLLSQLRSIYNFILILKTHQEALYAQAEEECKARNEYNAKAQTSTGFGLTLDDEKRMKERLINFNAFLHNIKTMVKNLSKSYEQIIKDYLRLLSTSTVLNLQLLSVRLDFNDYYGMV